MNTEPDQREPRGAAELSEDVTGFGVAELRTLKDLVLRPHTVLEAWMQAGPTGGGLYARPLRLYLALCGFMTLILFVKGGDTQISALPPEVLQSLADQAGKSVDAFVADAENWYSVALIPVSCAFYALVSIPLLRWWDPEDLGWRRGLRRLKRRPTKTPSCANNSYSAAQRRLLRKGLLRHDDDRALRLC